jgi:MSHA biogenesis protein MshQ
LFMDGVGVAEKLYHEVEFFSGSSGELVAWVKIPSLVYSQDAEFYLYYGNSGCGSQQFSEKVWDANYCSVWHLSDLKDSTLNDNDGTNHGTNDGLGKISFAKDFIDSNNDYIEVSDMPTPSDNVIETATLEAWIYPRELANSAIINKMDNDYEPDRRGYNFHLENYKTMFGVWPGTWYVDEDGIIAKSTEDIVSYNNWQYIAAAVDLSKKNIELYYNGEETPSSITIKGTPPAYFYDIDLNEWFGAYRGEGFTDYYNGLIDEIRISKICRSTSWISTGYNNQNNPSNFLSFGPEETVP